MSWQTEEYYESQRRALRPATFARLRRNEWTSSECRFIEPEVYDGCVESGLGEDLSGSLFLGVDVGHKRDSTAGVAVKYDQFTDKLVVAAHRIWQPQPGQILDLSSTLEFFIRGLSQRAQIVKLLYDPSQAQRSTQLLREMWIDVEELPQTQNNLSTATQTLYDDLINRQLRIYSNQELRAHVLNASTMTKENQKRKIDVCIALSFAILGEIRYGRQVDHDPANFRPIQIKHGV